MKYHVIFLTALVSVLGVFAYLAMTFSDRDLLYLDGKNGDFAQALNSFRESHEPAAEINFTALYGRNGQFEVLHPMLDMQRLSFQREVPSCIGEGAESPDQDQGFACGPDFQSKRDMLERLLNEGKKLPDVFLTSPPFVDSSGYSYVYLLSQKDVRPYNERAWIEQHLSFFKASELGEILKKYRLQNPDYLRISQLSESEMEEVIRGAAVVVTKHDLLVKDESKFGFSPLRYWAYEIQDLQNFLKDGKYELVSYSPDRFCLQRIGNACWTYSSKQAVTYLYQYSLLILALVGLTFFGFLCLYVRYLYDKNREQKRHRLSLQVLSHEFRTPVSSMILLMDQLRANQNLEVADQDRLTRLSTEIYRLQRIVETSKTYLQAEGRRIHLQSILIPSVNNWILDYVSESHLRIQCELLAVDRSIRVDPYWLKFVLSSLVQNAFAHGKAPVSVRLKNQRNQLKITVEDHGVCEFDSFGQMADAFVKSRRSKGMGLGLNIVKLIADELGSEIQFSKFPTSFTIFLGRG